MESLERQVEESLSCVRVAFESLRLHDLALNFEEPLPDLKLPDPTQVAYDGEQLLIVADSGWASVDKPNAPRASGASIVAVPLSSDCRPK